MKELEELTGEIREKLPRLTTVQEYTMNDGAKMKFGENYPVLLNDVLQWYDENVEFETNNGQGFYTRGFYDDFENWFEWDMSKPYLKDQSPELITFLHGLIKK